MGPSNASAHQPRPCASLCSVPLASSAVAHMSILHRDSDSTALEINVHDAVRPRPLGPDRRLVERPGDVAFQTPQRLARAHPFGPMLSTNAIAGGCIRTSVTAMTWVTEFRCRLPVRLDLFNAPATSLPSLARAPYARRPDGIRAIPAQPPANRRQPRSQTTLHAMDRLLAPM